MIVWLHNSWLPSFSNRFVIGTWICCMLHRVIYSCVYWCYTPSWLKERVSFSLKEFQLSPHLLLVLKSLLHSKFYSEFSSHPKVWSLCLTFGKVWFSYNIYIITSIFLHSVQIFSRLWDQTKFTSSNYPCVTPYLFRHSLSDPVISLGRYDLPSLSVVPQKSTFTEIHTDDAYPFFIWSVLYPLVDPYIKLPYSSPLFTDFIFLP